MILILIIFLALTEGDPNFVERAKRFGSSMLKAAFDYEDKEMINNPMEF